VHAGERTDLVRTGAPPARRRRLAALGLAVVVVVLAATAATYHRQIWSYATHLKGGPSSTWPFPDADARQEPLLRIAVAGDVGDRGTPQRRVAEAMARIGATQPHDVLLLLGDNVYPHGDPTKLPRRVFEPFDPVLSTGAELLAILGNHDVVRGHGDDQIAALGMPGRWWSRDEDDVLLVGLDSTRPHDPDQLAWLDRTLASTTARWRIVALHHPPYSAGYQGSSRDVRETFTPLFTRHDVQLVLSGHDHDYQRSVPLAGVTYVVTGGGASTRRTGTRSFTAVAYATPHYTDVTVYPDRLVLRAVDRDARVFDEHTLTP
jgi:hypothetical protein